MTLITQTDTVDRNEFSKRALCESDPVERFLRVGVLELDRYEHVVKLSNVRIELSKMEFKLLEVLMRNAPRQVASDVLRERVWGSPADSGTNRLEVLVNQLRRKIGPHVIATARGYGYRIVDFGTAA